MPVSFSVYYIQVFLSSDNVFLFHYIAHRVLAIDNVLVVLQHS